MRFLKNFFGQQFTGFLRGELDDGPLIHEGVARFVWMPCQHVIERNPPLTTEHGLPEKLFPLNDVFALTPVDRRGTVPGGFPSIALPVQARC